MGRQAVVKRRHGQSVLGLGVYALPEAARLVQTTTSRVRRWLLGYRFPLRTGASGESAPIFQPHLPELEGHWAISFLDLVELMFIKAFRDLGLSLPYIRRAAREAAGKWNADHPFCMRRLCSDGYEIFETVGGEGDQEDIRAVVGGQYHFALILDPYLKHLEYDLDGGVRRWWPLGTGRPVVVDPAVCFGRPVVSPWAIPTEALVAAIKANESPKQVAAWFSIPVAAVRAAMDFEGSLAA